MRSPSIKRLTATFDIPPAAARLIKRLCALADDREGLRELVAAECPATDAYARSCYHDPFRGGMWRRTMILHAVDIILEGYGVECLGGGGTEAPPFEYVNFGDPYAVTLIYRRDSDNLTIGSWGDIAERRPDG